MERSSPLLTFGTYRTHHIKVPWSKLVWFKQGVPRYAFITRLDVKDRLSTGTRRRVWGITQGCPFCGEPEESRDHLYFACPYTYGLWLQILARILGATRDRLASIFLRIALQVTVVGPNFGH